MCFTRISVLTGVARRRSDNLCHGRVDAVGSRSGRVVDGASRRRYDGPGRVLRLRRSNRDPCRFMGVYGEVSSVPSAFGNRRCGQTA